MCLTEKICQRPQRVYLESLCTSVKVLTEDALVADQDSEIALRQELDSIYTEIPDINQLVVTQEHLTPLTQSMAISSTEIQEYTHSGLEFVRFCS